jgi:5-methylcytosine-specific restriction endonuclease McrA
MARRHLLVEIARTDCTFSLKTVAARRMWVGKCIHCNRRLAFEEDGTAGPNVTIEHILPRNHGGGDDLRNLAIACQTCNQGKGTRHDCQPLGDPKLEALIERLRERRRSRWREPSS